MDPRRDERLVMASRINAFAELRCFSASWFPTVSSCSITTAGDLGRIIAMAQIGQPIRRYTVIPLQEPVSPTPERIVPPPPIKSPAETPPVINPEPEPVRQRNLCPT